MRIIMYNLLRKYVTEKLCCEKIFFLKYEYISNQKCALQLYPFKKFYFGYISFSMEFSEVIRKNVQAWIWTRLVMSILKSRELEGVILSVFIL